MQSGTPGSETIRRVDKTRWRIAILLYAGFDELDVFGPYEVLRMAAEKQEDVEVLLAAVDSNPGDEVMGSRGAVVRSQSALDRDWDVVIVPGGGWVTRTGAFAEAERGVIPAALTNIHARGTTVASVCTGAMLLAAAGLTEGRPAITHQVAVEDLRATGAEVVEARVVDDGDIVTAGGVTAGIDLALWLVERLWGGTLADRLAHRLEYTRSRDIHRGPHFIKPLQGADSIAE